MILWLVLALNFDMGYGYGRKKRQQLRGCGHRGDTSLDVDNEIGEEDEVGGLEEDEIVFFDFFCCFLFVILKFY